MKKLCWLVCFVVIALNGSAQNYHVIDSLNRLLAADQEDTNRVRHSMLIADAYVWSYPDSAFIYAQPSLQLARKLGDEFGEIYNLGTLGYIFSIRRNDSLALATIFKSIHMAEKANDPRSLLFSYSDAAVVYYNIGEYRQSLKYCNKLLPISSSDPVRLGFTYTYIGKCYYGLNELDSSIHYLQLANEKIEVVKYHWNAPDLFLGHVYRKKGNYPLSLNYYRTSVNAALYQDYVLKDVLEGYIGMAKVFKETNLTDSSLWYAKKAINLADLYSFPSENLDACILLKDIYTSGHQIDSAFKYLELTLSLKDSVFSQEKNRTAQNLIFTEQQRQHDIEADKLQYKNSIKIYALLGGLAALLLLAVLLLRNNRQKRKANHLLQQQKEKVESTLTELKSTQAQLIQSEKMASLGELTAGIAHEIQNPLNFVNNFSEVNKELLDEMENELKADNKEEAISIAKDIRENEEKINHHGKRADTIVKGMLQHSRSSSGTKEPTDINALADEYLRLTYHGLRAKDKTFNATLQTDFDDSIGKINVIPQDIGRVLLNLYNNAFYAATDKKKQQGEVYEPTVSVSTKKINNKVEIKIKDNGNGIPQKVLDKIFQPFFTTKPTGQGTGLGLSLSYDIIKAHGGEIKAETKEGAGAEFIIQLLV
jgi:two-component system NtrC family sensor kinase